MSVLDFIFSLVFSFVVLGPTGFLPFILDMCLRLNVVVSILLETSLLLLLFVFVILLVVRDTKNCFMSFCFLFCISSNDFFLMLYIFRMKGV